MVNKSESTEEERFQSIDLYIQAAELATTYSDRNTEFTDAEILLMYENAMEFLGVDGIRDFEEFRQEILADQALLRSIREVAFQHREKRERIELGYALNNTYRETSGIGPLTNFDKIPQTFRYPAAFFTIFGGGTRKVTSPYGEVPQEFIGGDNRYYIVSNIIYVNSLGHSAKLENIVQIGSDQLTEHRIELYYKTTPRLPHLVPQRSDSCYVAVSPIEIVNARKKIADIKAGEYVSLTGKA